MLRLVVGLDGRHSFLVSSEGVREIRGFLRECGLRPHRPGFDYIKAPPFLRLTCYRLSGDEHYIVAGKKLARIDFGQLSMYLIQGVHLSEYSFRKARLAPRPR
jgi:hypothetical protein